MFNAEYYSEKKTAFDTIFDNLISSETAAYCAVSESLRMEEEKDEEAYRENDGLSMFTSLADSMQIENLADFDAYLTKCLGGNLRQGVESLRRHPSAFFTPSLAIAEKKNELALLDVSGSESDRILVKEKIVSRREYRPGEGIIRCEKTVSVPMTKKEIKKKNAIMNFFPEMQNVFVNDRRFPLYPIISVVLCMVLFIFPIFLTILNNEVAVENKERDAYIRELNEDISELQGILSIKNDMNLIGELAKDEYGMIELELSEVRVMEAEDEFIVLKEEKKDDLSDVLIALLSAIGIYGGDN